MMVVTFFFKKREKDVNDLVVLHRTKKERKNNYKFSNDFNNCGTIKKVKF